MLSRAMASTTRLVGDDDPQQSILTLDKCDETFPLLISRACKILEIDLDEEPEQAVDGSKSYHHATTSSDPRPEWALKWLLKKFESADSKIDNPRIHWQAWMLLRALISRVSISNSARLLKAHKLVGIICKTFQGLYNHIHLPGDQENDENSESSDVSSNTIKSSTSKTRISKKRKRDGTEITGCQPLPNLEILDVHKIFVAICGLLAHLQFLIADRDHKLGYAIEHMKSSLKTEPEEAASILGNALYLVDDVLQAPYRCTAQRETSPKKPDLMACKLCIFAAIEFWESRSDHLEPVFDSPINVSNSYLIQKFVC